MAGNLNLKLAKLAVSMVSVAALAGIAGRLSAGGAAPLEERPAEGQPTPLAGLSPTAPPAQSKSQGRWWQRDDHDDDDHDDDDDDHHDDDDDDKRYWSKQSAERRSERSTLQFGQPSQGEGGGSGSSTTPKARTRRS